MPHFIIEYSANVEKYVNMSDLCEHIRATAVQIDAFPMPGVRVRAIKVEHYAIADGGSNHGFVDISVRLRAGRTPDVKRAATQAIFEAAKTFLDPALSNHSLALSFEMRDIDPELSPKCGSIRDHLKES